MTAIPPPPEVADADLELVRRHVLGDPGDHRVSGQISLGRSEAVRLRPETAGLDPELVRALERDADAHHYYLIMLRCTFGAGTAPVVGARLSVALRQPAVRGADDPVVWSSCCATTSNLHGLVPAFLRAGARAVVGASWPVEPDMAATFFVELYAHLAAGVEQVATFRAAQNATRARHPDYRDRGGFSYFGR